ncbi:MAG: NADP-dependent phosphogluconate dehydrogenase [Chitinophagaceae bacterium]|nr:NADP-dependent phosphogluconate dehydrogenase [Chitinophagaceae bacterium]
MGAAFGMIGLGTMGRNLLLNMADHGISVCGYDRNPAQQKLLLELAADKPVTVADSMKTFIESLEKPRRIMMLVPAGKIVDMVIEEAKPFLSAGDVLIDGGNSHYIDTDRRIEALKPTGIHFTGMGVSGGEDGARFGPSMMPGGSAEGYAELKPILEKIAAQTEDGPCVCHTGTGSAGHYTKMVHNGIEYAIMQLISEVYGVLKNVYGYSNDELHKVFDQWNKEASASFLLEITANIFKQADPMLPGSQLIDQILDRAAMKGTGMWTSASALELHVPLSIIDEAVAARDLSSFKPERQIISQWVTPVKPLNRDDKHLQTLADALHFGTALSYIQGFHLLQTASAQFKYGINPAEIARIWKGGCIIRSKFLDDIRKTFLQQTDLLNLLLDKDMFTVILGNRAAAANIISIATAARQPIPCLSSSLQYFDMFSSGRLPSNLIQAQRDYFGAHTYERNDQAGSFHTDWTT